MAVQKIAVIGGGTMGSGIALTAATHGIQSVIVDIHEEQLTRAQAYHAKQIARSIQKERMTETDGKVATENLSYVSSMEDANDADWVVEAATENVDVKKSIFKSMESAFGPNTVLATNTSSISITDLASAIPDADHGARRSGTHGTVSRAAGLSASRQGVF